MRKAMASNLRITVLRRIPQLLIILLQCIPLRGFWDKSIQATCGVDDYKFFQGNSIPNIITDLILLALPMPSVWALQITRSQKISLAMVFVLGGLSVTIVL